MGSLVTEALSQSKYIAPTSIQEAFNYAPLLRADDRREIIGCGHDPLTALPLSIAYSQQPIKFTNPCGEVAGFAGVVDEGEGIGRVWLLCTPAVEMMPILFYKGARSWIDSLRFTMLHNIADPRNHMHLKFLHMLGFKRLSYVPVGPRKRTYVEFAKLCATL
jgi:hypothetical protein